jgi:hypothetical protein
MSVGRGRSQNVNSVESGTESRKSRGWKPVELIQGFIGLASGYAFMEVPGLWPKIAILLSQGIVIIIVVITQQSKDGGPGGAGDPQPPRNPWWRAVLIQAGTFLGGIAVNYAWDYIKVRINVPGLPQN